jgi:hypothetical protein
LNALTVTAARGLDVLELAGVFDSERDGNTVGDLDGAQRVVLVERARETL